MKRAVNQLDSSVQDSQDLFLSLAEQVKLPFIQIANSAETLAGQENPALRSGSIEAIQLASKSAIRLIDSYLLNVELGRQQSLNLEPVSLSSIVYDAKQAVSDFAKLHNCRLELHVAGRYAPVMAHTQAVFAALTTLGTSFIEAAASQKETADIQLVVRKTTEGINVGVFSPINLSYSLLTLAREMRGKSHQPLVELDGSAGAGIFVADELFSKMRTEMKVASFKGLSGLAATLTPSNQLTLV